MKDSLFQPSNLTSHHIISFCFTFRKAAAATAEAQQATGSTDPLAIWNEDEIPNEEDLIDKYDKRPTPKYEFFFKSMVGSEDVFLGTHPFKNTYFLFSYTHNCFHSHSTLLIRYRPSRQVPFRCRLLTSRRKNILPRSYYEGS